MKTELINDSLRHARNAIRHAWERVFGKTPKTRAIEAAWQNHLRGQREKRMRERGSG